MTAIAYFRFSTDEYIKAFEKCEKLFQDISKGSNYIQAAIHFNVNTLRTSVDKAARKNRSTAVIARKKFPLVRQINRRNLIGWL